MTKVEKMNPKTGEYLLSFLSLTKSVYVMPSEVYNVTCGANCRNNEYIHCLMANVMFEMSIFKSHLNTPIS